MKSTIGLKLVNTFRPSALIYFNTFQYSIKSLFPMKLSENQRFFDVVSEYRNDAKYWKASKYMGTFALTI